MKILVTGGAGFIGSNIADAYIKEGHEVTIVDDLSTGKKAHVNRRAALMVGMDVRDPNISTLFAESRFEVVNHLAAQLDVRKSVQDPFFDASVNILGTLRLLECCLVVWSSQIHSSLPQGEPFTASAETHPATEEDRLLVRNRPMASSKAAAERYIRFYGDVYRTFPTRF